MMSQVIMQLQSVRHPYNLIFPLNYGELIRIQEEANGNEQQC